MAHQWEVFRPRFTRHRRCKKCGLTQQYSSGSRRRISGDNGRWYPPVGQCGLVNLKLRRMKSGGGYVTADGRFRVWQSPEFERRWYVNLANEDGDAETLYLGGFMTKQRAVEWLSMNAVEYARQG